MIAVIERFARFFENQMEPVPFELEGSFPMRPSLETEIAIVASAFGADGVRRHGHAAWLGIVAGAGAAAFEVRRELFTREADASLEALRELGAAVAAEGLWAVYSTPTELYFDDGALNSPGLAAAFSEADALGARWVKLQLGMFSGRADAAMIERLSAGRGARLLVENGQRMQDGAIVQFLSLFSALEREGAPHAVGMTFDIGNWQWPGEAPIVAARSLAAHVEYVHCKSSAGEGMRRFPIAPSPADPLVKAVLDILPRNAPRGIEFPLDAAAPADDARRAVRWLATA